jgi:hypothetical protein
MGTNRGRGRVFPLQTRQPLAAVVIVEILRVESCENITADTRDILQNKTQVGTKVDVGTYKSGERSGRGEMATYFTARFTVG